jgi:hypothetical protein
LSTGGFLLGFTSFSQTIYEMFRISQVRSLVSGEKIEYNNSNPMKRRFEHYVEKINCAAVDAGHGTGSVRTRLCNQRRE